MIDFHISYWTAVNNYHVIKFVRKLYIISTNRFNGFRYFVSQKQIFLVRSRLVNVFASKLKSNYIGFFLWRFLILDIIYYTILPLYIFISLSSPYQSLVKNFIIAAGQRPEYV
jgi:hypothetical protein